MTEKQIQNYIWDNRANWSDLLLPVEFPPKIIIENPSHILPSEIVYNILITEYEEIYNSIYGLDLMGQEVPLRKDLDSTIRADFLGILDGQNGLVVVELKKSKQTERQAFTELLAYGGHLKTVFAPMSKMDIAYVLISPMEERIVREATINSIIYDKLHIISLIPTWENDDITTLKLKPWIPSFKEVETLTTSVFSENNFDVFKVTWEALEGDWSPDNKGENPSQYMIDRMNTVSAYAAQIMEAKGIHGFVYTMQNWSELIDIGHLINAIVLVGINPYKATKNKTLTIKHGLKQKDADKIDIDSMNIIDIIPELEKHRKENNLNHLSFLSMTWDNAMAGIGFKIVELLTKKIEGSNVETSYGGFDWHTYQKYTREDSYCHLFEMRVTGLLRDLLFEYSSLDYDYLQTSGHIDHMQYWHGEIPEYIADLTTSHNSIRSFIHRLFDPYYDFGEDLEEFEDDTE